MLTQNRRLATLLVAAVASTGFVAPSVAGAKATKAASAATILKDCKKDGVISKRYRLADLKKAKTALGTKTYKKKYPTFCKDPVASAIGALSGKTGKNSVTAIVKECSNSGAIKKKYKLATLKKAVKSLGADGENYSQCADVINSQINTLKV